MKKILLLIIAITFLAFPTSYSYAGSCCPICFAQPDTSASTVCSGTTTYLDGEGNCDDISGVYVQAADWTTIDNYPSACTGVNFVQGLGDTLTCAQPSDVTGNAATATALAANPTDCSAGTWATTIEANGNLTCSAIDIVTDTTPQLGGNLDLNTHEVTVKEVDPIPVGYMIDGTTAPAALATLTSTNKIDTRAFDGAANEDLKFVWQVPFDFTGTTFTFRVVGYVSNATAPANTEVVAFSLGCASMGNSEGLATAVGTAQTSSLTADATYVQYDRLATAFSSAITPSGTLAAGESVHCNLIRLATTTDTYAQDFDVAFVEIKYSRALTND